jgi:integrase
MPRPSSGQVLERRGKHGRVWAIRFRAYGRRYYETLNGEVATRAEAEEELANRLADVRRGIWRPSTPEPVAQPTEEPTFHEFASEWFAARKLDGIRPRTIEHLEWALTVHLLPAFARYRVGQLTPQLVDGYRTAKVRDREERLVDRPLSNTTINRTIAVLAAVLDQAVEYGHLATNPAPGKRRRLKQARPRRTWLELDEVRSLLETAGTHRALLATMVLGGLRVGEAIGLRWRDVDLAGGTLQVRHSKTDAGERTVDLSPDLLGELKLHRANSRFAEARDLVFPTLRGTARDRHNVRARVLAGAIERANKQRAEHGLARIQDGVTNHSLRRTFASLLYEAGASPAYVMAQMGHRSSALALEVYARKMERERDTGARMDALIRGAEWAQTGTSADVNALTAEVESTA